MTSIVVLGRGSHTQADRALVASQLWQNERSSHIFVSGMSDSPPIVRTLQELGVPERQVQGERCSQSTWENGLFSETLINSQEQNRILLITDAPHMVRAFLVFKAFGFEVIPHPMPSETENIFSVEQSYLISREYIATLAYSISGKLRSGSAENQQKNKARAAAQIAHWECQVP
ncbi:MAG: YdcF family protein [Leptolyngbya sp. SIO1D8]|nr:YdcF family protein [Leptolyngbya sp. SIO1D8]